MFFDKLAGISKRLICLAAAGVTAVTTSTYSFADIDLEVSVSNDYVCFTQNVTSNNSYLEKIGADNAEELRTSMIANNVYLEAIDKAADNVEYEIVISGASLGNQEITDLSTISSDRLNSLYEEYSNSITKKSDTTEITLLSSELTTVNDLPYFVTDTLTVSDARVKVYARKYYTMKNGYYYMYTIQSAEKTISDEQYEQLRAIVSSAEYKPIEKSLLDNGIVSELLSSIVTLVVPIAILGLILFILIKMTSKKKS